MFQIFCVMGIWAEGRLDLPVMVTVGGSMHTGFGMFPVGQEMVTIAELRFI